MNTVYFLYNFNNYHNRRCIRFDTLSGYLDSSDAYDSRSGVNFNENDGVNATITYNQSSQELLAINPDYMLVLNQDNTIQSRWFIIDGTKLRNGQYSLELLRDGVADYYNDILDAPTYIEKATISDASNPFIYNRENIEFNQIKKSETLLKDKSKMNWIVGYVAPNATAIEGASVHSTPRPDYIYNDMASFAQSFIYYDHCSLNEDAEEYPVFKNYRLGIKSYHYPSVTTGNQTKSIITTSLYWTNASNLGASYTSEDSSTVPSNKPDYKKSHGIIWNDTQKSNFVSSLKTNINTGNNLNLITNNIKSRIIVPENIHDTNVLEQYNGKVFKIGTKYYKVYTQGYVRYTYQDETRSQLAGTSTLNIVDNLSIWTSITEQDTVSSISLGASYDGVKLIFTEVASIDGYINVTVSKRLGDAPYAMFCIPYDKDGESITLKNIPNPTTLERENISIQSHVQLDFASEIAAQWKQSGSLYDLQLLPYCPLPQNMIEDHAINFLDTTGGLGGAIYDNNTNNILGVLYWCESSNFSFNINYSKQVSDYKVENQCDMYRLCSPNYNGIFEYSLAMNGGIDYINVDCTYKPYSPYIHLNPNFKNLYGNDFNDARGLICAGDFSLPQLNDSWTTYEIQNKNYQNQFQRDITNLEVNRDIQRTQQKWAIASGIMGATSSGAITGGMTGGPIAALGGAAASGALSTIGGIMDYKLSEKQFGETIDYKNDTFNYSLDNIKALPRTLSNVSALNENNKYFPFIEYYTCTDREKEAFRDKLKYNGMTVMAIGTIREYLQPEESYIKGKMIRIQIPEDDHLIEHISNELNKGVFIK